MSNIPPQSLQSIAGPAVAADIAASKVLVVGAGGIGCELLKNLVLGGFTNMVLLDLDTIEVSNLNRQFLFRKQHVGSPKASTAREAALRFNPNAQIEAYQINIKDPFFSAEYVSQFKLVFSALDNNDARNYLNVLCFRAQVPLLESGTQGYHGQAWSIFHGLSGCQGCLPTATPVTFPVCTIRSTPDKPEHCIAWAKNIYAVLFDEPDDAQEDFMFRSEHLETLHLEAHDDENNNTTANINTDAKTGESKPSGIAVGEDGKVQSRSPITKHDLETLEQSLQFLKSIPTTTPLQQILHKVFQIVYYYFTWAPVEQHTFEERWFTRRPPTAIPLPLPRYVSDSFSTTGAVPQPANTPLSPTAGTVKDETYYTHKIGLQKQQTLQPIGFYMNQFITSSFDLFTRKDTLAKQYGANSKEQYIGFDKDDQLAMAFVAAASNLRMYCYHIPLLSEFALKGIAGNIIHAIATTNAIAAGLLVSHAIRVFQHPQIGEYLSIGSGLTKAETNSIRATINSAFSFNCVNTGGKYISVLGIETPSIKCWCSRPIVQAKFTQINNQVQEQSSNPFDSITGQQFMLMVEGLVGGIALHERIKLKKEQEKNGVRATIPPPSNQVSCEDNISDILENSTNIEDFAFLPLLHQNVKDLDSRLDGFYYKIAIPQRFATGQSDLDQDGGDDDDDDECDNPVIFQSLTELQVTSGTSFSCSQLGQGVSFVVKCYDNEKLTNSTTSSNSTANLSFPNDHYTRLVKAMFKSSKILSQPNFLSSTQIFTADPLIDPNQEVIRAVVTVGNGVRIEFLFNKIKIIEFIPRLLSHEKALRDKEEAEWKAVQQSKNKLKNFMAAQKGQNYTFSLLNDDGDNDDDNGDTINSIAKKTKTNDQSPSPATTTTNADSIHFGNNPTLASKFATSTNDDLTTQIDPNAMVTIGAPATAPPSTFVRAQDDVVELDLD